MDTQVLLIPHPTPSTSMFFCGSGVTGQVASDLQANSIILGEHPRCNGAEFWRWDGWGPSGDALPHSP